MWLFVSVLLAIRYGSESQIEYIFLNSIKNYLRTRYDPYTSQLCIFQGPCYYSVACFSCHYISLLRIWFKWLQFAHMSRWVIYGWHCHSLYFNKGDRCEECTEGYSRHLSGHLSGDVSSTMTQCIPCDCSGQSCDQLTGECICTDNTTGDSCEACVSGYYGDPTSGGELSSIHRAKEYSLCDIRAWNIDINCQLFIYISTKGFSYMVFVTLY